MDQRPATPRGEGNVRCGVRILVGILTLVLCLFALTPALSFGIASSHHCAVQLSDDSASVPGCAPDSEAATVEGLLPEFRSVLPAVSGTKLMPFQVQRLGGLSIAPPRPPPIL